MLFLGAIYAPREEIFLCSALLGIGAALEIEECSDHRQLVFIGSSLTLLTLHKRVTYFLFMPELKQRYL